MALISAFFFAFIAYLLDPVFHSVGAAILSRPELKPLFTQLYNMPIIPLTRFNNSVVMGAGVVAILAAPFVFLLSRILVKKYRKAVVERFKNSKVWKAIQASTLYKWYYKYNEYYG